MEKHFWDSNQPIPYLIFYKHLDKFMKVFGHTFKIIKREKMSFILYPASGGFENQSMIPEKFLPILSKLSPKQNCYEAWYPSGYALSS
ncbi:MAG: hypothetical protein IPL67_17550 [Ignavibacteria bacterium]|nr:hypothetical protein [Ignavibacteria bacterium]